MTDIKLLDCTLRDGGYINDWEFGENNINNIISSLTKSNIEYIEYGFLSDRKDLTSNHALYSDFDSLDNSAQTSSITTVMLNFEDNSKFKFINNNKATLLRISFKPHHIEALPDYLSQLKKQNIKYTLNPMHISLYDEDSIKKLCKITNELSPEFLTAVDSMGIMTPEDSINIYYTLNKYIDKNIGLGFHFHNNLNLAFENTKSILELKPDRNIILDCCISGLSRGGGILETEIITDFLNKHYYCNYNTSLINTLSQNIISSVKEKQVKYKNIYYTSAKLKCHPNYATYLQDKGFTNSEIEKFLGLIPIKNKPYYSKTVIDNIIKSLY